MPYELSASSQTPALIIYLLDISASMKEPLGARPRIDVVMEALDAVLDEMIARSTKGSRVAPRYRLAIATYSDDVYDALGGIKPISDIANMGKLVLPTQRGTNTAAAFAWAERLLKAELSNLQHCPPPLVCHMTDGEYTTDDPEPICRRLMRLAIPDGQVLVENIFISDTIMAAPVASASTWPGILPSTPLSSKYAEKLRAMSSVLPERYRSIIQESGYNLAQGAVMMLPGMSPELVKLGFVMSMSTPPAGALPRRTDV